jgi:nucleoid DNA-binding protein
MAKKTTRKKTTRKTAKKTAKKTARKKTTRKKTSKKTTKKTGTNFKVTAAKKPRTKSEIYRTIAEETGLKRTDVVGVFDCMSEMINKDLGRAGCGVFNVPGLMKITVKTKPATKARKGVNPFTGQEMMFKAKPARKQVKIRPLKGLKDMV